MMVMAAAIVVELWAPAPRDLYSGSEYGAGVACDLCDC
jgi:hypothetical protein